ncbi:MAG: protein kinase [bacterium]
MAVREPTTASLARLDPNLEVRAFLRTVVAFRCGDELGVGEAINISANGMFLATEQLPPLGGVVELKLSLAEEIGKDMLVLRGEVVRREIGTAGERQPRGVGVRFLNITAEDQDKIRQWVFSSAVRTIYQDELQTRDVVGLEEARRYELIGLIGSGATSEVFKAYDASLGLTVALKVLKAHYVHDDEFLGRLRREERLLGLVESDHVARIYGSGMLGRRPFISMEFIPGIQLSRLIVDRGWLTERHVLDLMIDATEGVAAAHKQGIVHRDLKPSNLMVTPEGRVKVLDFGIARAREDMRITRAGDFLGTPAYSAPEQLVGASVTPRGDVYSLGCVLFEALTGRLLLDADSIRGIVEQQIHSHVPSPRALRPEVSASLERVVQQCLAPDPADRYPDAEALRRALLAVRASAPAAAASAAPLRRRALVADRDDASARVVQLALEAQGFEVVRVQDGYKLVELALEKGADVVLSSAILPNIDGLEAAQILRSSARTKDVPLVLMSDREGHRDVAAFIGRCHFLKKPIGADSVRACIEAIASEARA